VVSQSEALSTYQAALNNLPVEKADDSPQKVMSVLVARDGVARALSDQQPPSTETVIRLAELDERLKAAATTINVIIGQATLVKWRETMQPPASAWWWHLDERVAAEDKPAPLWMVFAGICIAISISLAVEISIRFLSTGADFLGVFSVLSQVLLILLTGSTFTQAGMEELDRVLSRLGIERRFQDEWKAGLAFGVLLILLALRFLLPGIARYYNDQGVRLQQSGSVTSAIENYKRAISLNPDYAEAHYNLATTYEDVLEYDKALGEYQTALRTDPKLYLAYNNLARLYMLHQNDFTNALSLLNIALEMKLDLDRSQQTYVQYSFLKNRGWANLGLKYLRLAETDLRQALMLRADGAAAHCLLAQVLEAQANSQAALTEWEACLRYEKNDVVEANWLGLARERLSQGGPK
jgi:tetratricopeptide (TPR) repeat protein